MKISGNNKRYAIKVDRLSFGYQKKDTCFSSACFELLKGEKVVLLSGEHRGKSTLIRILAGLEQNYIGKIELMGYNSNNFAKAYKNMVYIPEQPVLLENKSVADNIEYAYNVLNNNSKNMDYVAKLPSVLDSIANVKAKKLSLKERTLLEIERAKLKKIKLLLLDRSLSDISSFNHKLISDAKKHIDDVKPLYRKLIESSESAIVVCETRDEIEFYGAENFKVLYIYLGKIYSFENLESFQNGLLELEGLRYVKERNNRLVKLGFEYDKYYLYISSCSSQDEFKLKVCENSKKRKINAKNMKKRTKTNDLDENNVKVEDLFIDKICLDKYPKFMQILESSDVLSEDFFVLSQNAKSDKKSISLSKLDFMLFLCSTGERII